MYRPVSYCYVGGVLHCTYMYNCYWFRREDEKCMSLASWFQYIPLDIYWLIPSFGGEPDKSV